MERRRYASLAFWSLERSQRLQALEAELTGSLDAESEEDAAAEPEALTSLVIEALSAWEQEAA